jgi:hypothetical protein
MGTFRDFNADLITGLVFSPDPMLGYRYRKIYEGRNGPYDDEPLRNLRLAVLEDGIACFQTYFFKPSPKNEKLSREAEEWIACDSDDPFSFSEICETLEIDPQWLRKELFRWKQKHKGMSRKRLLLSEVKYAAKRRKTAYKRSTSLASR